MTPLLEGLNKIYILAVRQQQQCVHRFYVRLPGSFGWWHLLLQANYGFLLRFLDPNYPHHSVAVGFYGQDSRVFSKTWLQHSTKKTCTTFRFLHVVLLLTQAFTNWPCKCHFQLRRETSILTFLGLLLKFEACKESVRSYLLLFQSSFFFDSWS